MKTYVYLHLCVIGSWEDIIIKIVNNFESSNLVGHVDEMRVCLYGDFIERKKAKILLHTYFEGKLNIKFESDDISLREKKTLEILSKDSHNEDDFRLLYLHSKGNSPNYNNNDHVSFCVADWVDYMLYFNVVRWKDSLSLLDSFDVCGVNLGVDHRSYTKGWHYSGNFWWANSTHIKKLKKIIEGLHPHGTRLDSEQWLCSEKFHGAELWSSDPINHYKDRYESSIYKNLELSIREVCG